MNRNDIEQAVLNFIAADAATDAAFNMLALEIFQFLLLLAIISYNQQMVDSKRCCLFL